MPSCSWWVVTNRRVRARRVDTELLATLITIVKFSHSMFYSVDLLFTKCDNCDNMVNLLFTNVGHPFTCEEGSLYYVLW